MHGTLTLRALLALIKVVNGSECHMRVSGLSPTVKKPVIVTLVMDS
jgi:hypothetical protein